MAFKDPGPVPDRWLNCPRKASDLITSKFLAFKTPLDNRFNGKVPEANRFTPTMLLNNLKSLKVSCDFNYCLLHTSAV